MIEQMLVEKFKQCLGEQYEVVGNEFFESNFTRTMPQAPGQFQTYIQQEAFDKYKDKIVAVVTVQAAQYATAQSLAINSTYTMTLWVPVNFNVMNAGGEFLKTPKFNVEQDLIHLRESLQNKTLTFGEKYRGELTFSEPVPMGNGFDYSGSFKRKMVVVSGKINLSEKHYYGRDYVIKIGKLADDNQIVYREVKNLNYINFTPQPSLVENHEQGSLIPDENAEAIKQVATFTIDDCSEDAELNDIFTALALSGEKSKEKYAFQASKFVNGEWKLYAEFPVYLTCNLVYSGGMSDTGIFTISCQRCGE